MTFFLSWDAPPHSPAGQTLFTWSDSNRNPFRLHLVSQPCPGLLFPECKRGCMEAVSAAGCSTRNSLRFLDAATTHPEDLLLKHSSKALHSLSPLLSLHTPLLIFHTHRQLCMAPTLLLLQKLADNQLIKFSCSKVQDTSWHLCFLLAQEPPLSLQ